VGPGGCIGHVEAAGHHPLAPGPVPPPGGIRPPQGRREAPVPRQMTAEDVRRTREAFVAAARNAIRAGFDGVEVHAANGYLLNQFLATSTNRRTDAYGGTVAGRIRFVVEVAEAVAEADGPERTGLRTSPRNPDHGNHMQD